MSEKISLTLDIFQAAELRTLLELARSASLLDSPERAAAERMLAYLREERWKQVPWELSSDPKRRG